jgi:Spy/CpxP family protein refolding chaperone
MTDRMSSELQLSADQKQKVYQIMLESQKQQMRTKEQTAKFNTQLDAVLTSEQKATMQRLKAQKVQPDRMSQLRQGNLQAAPPLRAEKAGIAK